MFRKLSSQTYCALPVILCLLLSISVLTTLLVGCKPSNPPDEQSQEDDHFVESNEVIVLVTDSDEWSVCLFKEHLVYSEAVKTNLPAPWSIPVRSEAQVLRTLEYASPSGERFITSDGYTFGMPSASVSKAGTKTQYSVLGLHIRKTTIDVPF